MAGIHPEISSAGGTRSYVLGLAHELHHRGHHVTLIGAGPPSPVGFGEFCSVTHKFPLSSYRFVLSLFRWLHRNQLEEDGIVHAQRPDDLYPFLVQSRGGRLICTLHGDPSRGVAERRPAGSILYRIVERRVLLGAAYIISVSSTGLATYRTRYPEIAEKSSVIPTAIDLGLFHPLERESSRAKVKASARRNLIFAGRLEPEKRVEVIFQAVSELKDPPEIFVAGRGRSERNLRTAAKQISVHFLGTIDHEEMPTLLSAMDGLLLPSAYEGLPTVALEALACGTPVIGTPVGDLPHIIENGRNGFLFDGSSQGLKTVLESHLEELESMRHETSQSALRFGWEPVTSQIMEVYNASF